MQLQLDPPKRSCVKIELELIEICDLHILLQNSDKLIEQSKYLARLRRTVSRIVGSHQFKTHFNAEVYEIVHRLKAETSREQHAAQN